MCFFFFVEFVYKIRKKEINHKILQHSDTASALRVAFGLNNAGLKWKIKRTHSIEFRCAPYPSFFVYSFANMFSILK